MILFHPKLPRYCLCKSPSCDFSLTSLFLLSELGSAVAETLCFFGNKFALPRLSFPDSRLQEPIGVSKKLGSTELLGF
jgi:hypothetical protein